MYLKFVGVTISLPIAFKAMMYLETTLMKTWGVVFSMLPILIALLPCVTAAGGTEEADDEVKSAYFMHLLTK